MSLLKKTEDAATTTTDTNTDFDKHVESTADAAAPAAAPATSTAVAARATAGALATAGNRVNVNIIAGLKNALPVDFNTLDAVQAVQGRFRTKEGEKPLGETIEMELLSWQESWVVSPNDKKADKKLVKFSDDGVTAKDGTDLKAHLQELLADGFKDAKLSKRATIVGALWAAEKDTPLIGNLIQIDLSPQSLNQFLRYQANSTFRLKLGKVSEEGVKRVKLTAVAAKGPNDTDYTRVEFDTAASVE